MSGSTFVNLPLDLLIDILSLLDPVDILSIRRTSKILADVGRERTVWINAYNCVSALNGLFASTFPFEDMTLADLEYSSTATSRFVARVRRDSPDGSLRHLSARSLLNPSPGVAFMSHALVPGGRYLLTRSSNQLVHLWDLGHHPLSLVNKAPVACMQVPPGDHDMRLIQWTADRRGIRLIFRVPIDQVSMRFETYEVYPLLPAPEFRRSATLIVQTPEWSTAFWPAGNLLVFQQATTLTMWDMDADQWVRFDTGAPAKQLDFCSGNIVVLHDNGMSISKVPTLHSHIPGANEAPTGPSSPAVHLHLREGISGVPSVAAVSCHWRPYITSEDLHYCIDMFSDIEDGACEVTHYRYQAVDVQALEGVDGGPSHVPMCIGHTPLPGTTWANLGMPKSVWVTNEDVLYFWQDARDVKVGATRIPGSGVPVEYVSRRAWTHEVDVQYEACPFSGRMCVRSERGSQEIEILDFLSGPALQ